MKIYPNENKIPICFSKALDCEKPRQTQHMAELVANVVFFFSFFVSLFLTFSYNLAPTSRQGQGKGELAERPRVSHWGAGVFTDGRSALEGWTQVEK